MDKRSWSCQKSQRFFTIIQLQTSTVYPFSSIQPLPRPCRSVNVLGPSNAPWSRSKWTPWRCYVRYAMRDARDWMGLDGTGLMGLGWLGPPKFTGYFCLIHEPHWIFGCLNPDLWNWTKIQSIQYWWNMWTKSDLVGGKERGKPCVQFSRRLMGYIMESLAGTHRVERFVGPESGWAGRTQGKWPWFGGSIFFSWTSDYCDLSILSGSS